MANYKDLNKLVANYSKKIQKGLPKVGKQGEKILSESMDTYIYGAYAPTVYNRTHSLQNSIFSELEVKDSHYFVLRVDFNSPSYNYPSLPPWLGDEDSVIDWQQQYGNNHSDEIQYYLEYNRGWYSSSGTGFISKGYKVFKDEFRANFRDAMKKQKLTME